MCYKVDPSSGYIGINNDADGCKWSMWYFCTEACGTFVMMAAEWNIQHFCTDSHEWSMQLFCAAFPLWMNLVVGSAEWFLLPQSWSHCDVITCYTVHPHNTKVVMSSVSVAQISYSASYVHCIPFWCVWWLGAFVSIKIVGDRLQLIWGRLCKLLASMVVTLLCKVSSGGWG